MKKIVADPKVTCEIVNSDTDEIIIGYKFDGRLYDADNNLLPEHYIERKSLIWLLIAMSVISMFLLYLVLND